MLSDAYKDAFLKQPERKVRRQEQGGKRRFVQDLVCQKPTPGFMGEVDVQIRKRKKLDQQISMTDVWKEIECADFRVKPWELSEERWNKLRQKGMTLFPTISQLWSQRDSSQMGGREALKKAHKQMIVLTDQMQQKHRRDRWKHKVWKLQES